MLIYDRNAHAREEEAAEMERKQILGWAGAAAATAISCVWAYWGAVENFHERWYSSCLWENLFMFFFQYLLFAFVFTLLGLLSLVWKKTGLALHLLAAGFCLYFFSGASFSVLGVLIVLPLAGFGLLQYFGEPRPRRWARRMMILAPLAVALAISIPQGIKVSQRTDDGYLGARTVEGNGVTLVRRRPGGAGNGAEYLAAAHGGGGGGLHGSARRERRRRVGSAG
jgi:hypothetical protein